MFEPLVADDSNTKYSASVVYIKTLKQIEQAQRQRAHRLYRGRSQNYGPLLVIDDPNFGNY